MKWLIQDIKAAFAQLKRAETWLVLGLMAGFGLIVYAIVQFAVRTDSILLYLHYTASTCRDMSNGPIIFLFCCMIFFALSVVVTFGELQRHIECKNRNAEYEKRQALIGCIAWGAVAIGIGTGVLLFFKNYCR